MGLWESCSKSNFKQLFHSMSVENIACLVVAMETCFPWILAKPAIFATDMLWESWAKVDSSCLQGVAGGGHYAA